MNLGEVEVNLFPQIPLNLPTIPIKNNKIIEVPLIKLKCNGTLTKLYQMVKILLIRIITLEHY